MLQKFNMCQQIMYHEWRWFLVVGGERRLAAKDCPCANNAIAGIVFNFWPIVAGIDVKASHR
ncbi:MAG TPA: hypothetical protein PLB97_09415 [Accumulibacter sp.]|jgi:hypothetical protein|nr:hypothetical protein [Accumulibacter sp.]HPP48290.1 hypothetical protein [Accumulibacter sp.]